DDACSLRFGRRRLRSLLLGMLPRVALADARGLPAQVAQVVELRSANAAALHDVDVIDDRRVEREDTLDADAEARLAHRDRLADPAMLARDADAFVRLETLFVAFLDAHMNAHRVAGLEVRDVRAQLILLNRVDGCDVHDSTSFVVDAFNSFKISWSSGPSGARPR